MMEKRNVTIWVMVVVVCLASSPVMAWTQFKDGQTHNIDYEINDDVWVDWEAPGMETTVNWLDGASMSSPYKLQGFEDSRLNIFGGSIGGLFAYNSSQVSMSGGSISAAFYAWDSSQVSMSGGLISSLYAYDSSQVTMSGGSVRNNLYAFDSSQVSMSGGSIGGQLILGSNAILTIDGSDFAVDDQPFGYGELTSILGGSWSSEPYRHLTGILASGDLLDNGFYIGRNARIVLVPEPATLLLLGLGAVLLRKKR